MERKRSKLDEKIGPKSPLPYILQLRNWIFGKKAPELLYQLGFYCLSVVAIIFLAWNILSSIALQMRYVVSENKNVSVKDFLSERAVELEIHPDYILPKLLTFFAISALLWFVFLFGLVLFWRKKSIFFWLTFGSVIAYLGMAIFYVGGLFFWEEFTDLDRLFLFVVLLILFSYRIFLFKKPEVE